MLSDFISNFSNLIYVLLGFITLDISTGVLSAMKTHSIKSSIFRHGGFKKYLVIVIVLMSLVLDRIFFNKDILYTCVSTYFIMNESISICENLKKLGLAIPDKFINTVKVLKDESEDKK